MTVIDTFFDNLEPPRRAELEKIRQLVHEIVPQAQEVISYGIPAFKYRNKYLVGFCSYKHHLSLFPTSSPILAFKDELAGYTVSSGTIQFTLDRPLPSGLVRRIILNRVADIDEKLKK